MHSPPAREQVSYWEALVWRGPALTGEPWRLYSVVTVNGAPKVFGHVPRNINEKLCHSSHTVQQLLGSCGVSAVRKAGMVRSITQAFLQAFLACVGAHCCCTVTGAPKSEKKMW